VDQLRGGSDAPVTAVSRVYETEPIGGPDGQGPYLNLVVELAVDPGVNPYRILEQCHRLEAAAGRVRTVRWGPRTLDADVLWIDGVVLDDPSLTIPHPRWRQRRFVMAPLGELAPDLADDEAIATAGGEVTAVGTL
jgi:2-amino-4-hydroxy-6-hydroxymethyldihydropteridine diphosphokinase